jgi:hypothetical protein
LYSFIEMPSRVALVTSVILFLSVVHSKRLLPIGSAGGRLPSRSPQRDIQYAVEEEAAVGTQIGRGLRLDAGMDDRYADQVLRTIRFRFLNEPPGFVEFSDVSAGILKTTARVDREQLCSSAGAVVSGNQHFGGVSAGDMCRIKLDIAVQPMQYFEILKVFHRVF